MSFFIALLLIWLLFGVIVSLTSIAKIRFAQDTVDMVYRLHRQNIISNIQAKVFLNDLDNPMDVESVREVRWQLEDIMRKEQFSA